MGGSELRADFWMNEYITPWDYYAHGITNVLAYRKTAFQEMYIVETGAYGRALVLDGKWQSSTGDEFLYHEPLVHPAFLLHGSPRSVLILGGGEVPRASGGDAPGRVRRRAGRGGDRGCP
jgi:spermidine synthase